MGTYVAAQWEGSASADALHAMPRVAGGNTIPIEEPGSSDFTNYLVGVSVLPGCLLLIFIVWSILLCCPFCRRCGSTLFGRKLLFLRVFFGAACVFALGSLAGAYLGQTRLDEGFSELLDASGDLTVIFNRGITIGDDAQSELTDARNTSLLIRDNDYGCPPQVSPDVSSVVSAIDEALLQVGEFDSDASSALRLKDQIVDYAEQGRGWWEIGSYVILGVLAACCLVFLASVVLGTCDVEVECLLWFLSYVFVPLSLFVLLLMVLLCIAYTVLAFVAADTCAADPTVTLLLQVEAHSTAFNYNFTSYYTSCSGSNPLQPPLDTAQAQVRAALTDVRAINSTALSFCTQRTALEARLGLLEGDLVAVDALVDRAREVIECAPVNRIYAKAAFDGLCGGAVDGATALFLSMTATMLLVLQLVTVRNVYQPGDEAFSSDAEGATALQSYNRGSGTSYTKANGNPEVELHNTYGNDFV